MSCPHTKLLDSALTRLLDGDTSIARSFSARPFMLSDSAAFDYVSGLFDNMMVMWRGDGVHSCCDVNVWSIQKEGKWQSLQLQTVGQCIKWTHDVKQFKG